MTTSKNAHRPGKQVGASQEKRNFQTTLTGVASTVFGAAAMAYGCAHLSGGDSLNIVMLCVGASLLADVTGKEARNA
jgi:hypothetical protein